MFPASERPEALSAASMKTVAVVAAVEAEILGTDRTENVGSISVLKIT